MIRAWRLTHERYADRAFDGEGAYLFGGRWNPPGYRMVYVSGSIALATLELLVNGIHPLEMDNYVRIPVDFPESTVVVFSVDTLPDDWKSDVIPDSTQLIGQRWITATSSAVLQVPSAVIDVEHNFLINPGHPDFSRLNIGVAKKYAFNERLLKKY